MHADSKRRRDEKGIVYFCIVFKGRTAAHGWRAKLGGGGNPLEDAESTKQPD